MSVSICCCFKPSKEVKKSIDYYDYLAPSVFHLQTSLQERILEAGLDKTATIYDMEDLRSEKHGVIRSKGSNVTCPIDGRIGSAYVHTLSGSEHVGTATHMLSYAWGYQYSDIVDTLVEFCQDNKLDPKETYVWICCLCNNQHRVVEKEVPFEEFKYVFHKRVTGIGSILAMMSPWNSPTYLQRIWCIFEMYSANADDSCDIQIIMPPREKNSLLGAVLKGIDNTGKDGIDDLFAALANTKVEEAQASRPTDKQNILTLVAEGPTYSGLNNTINQFMRTWISNAIMSAAIDEESNSGETLLDRQTTAVHIMSYATFFSKNGAHKEALDFHEKALRIYEGDNEEECMSRCYNNIGTEYESLGDYDKALEAHGRCCKIFESIYGTEHPNTSVSYFNIGFVHRKVGNLEKAVEYFNKSLEIDKREKGENHVDTATGYTNIGRIMQQNKDYDGASDMFTKVKSICESTYGKDHPNTANAYGDLALLNHVQGNYDDAIKWHKKSMKTQESILGAAHPDTLQVYQNIGGAYYEKGDFRKALEMVQKARKGFVACFGEDHPKSVGAKDWVDVVEQCLPD